MYVWQGGNQLDKREEGEKGRRGRNLTFSLDSAGHHLPYRSPQLDMPRVLKDPGIATGVHTDLLEI